MNKQDMMKIQTCVLKVNLHCEGCAHKVKKQLQKVEGVHKVGIDVEQGKATVSGNVDPSLLIKKLEKSGKHAELWGPQKGQAPFQLKNIQFDNMKDAKPQKGGFQIPPQLQMQMQMQMQQQMMNQKKGGKEDKFMGKDQKSVKFKLPEEEEDDDYEDDSDEFDEDEDDFDDEDFGAHHPPATKMAPVGHGQKPNKAASNGGHVKSNNGGDKTGGKGKKGGGINMLLKGILGKAGGKNVNGGKKGESKKDDGGGKNGKKNGGFPGGDGKNAAANGKGGGKNGGGKGGDGWSKKGGGGEDIDFGPKLDGKQKVLNEMNAAHKGGGGGRNMDAMGQMGNLPAAVNGGRIQGMGQQGNPYNQQQYMAQMMMMNQQRGNGPDAYNPMGYARPHPGMGYGPPPPGMGYGPPPPGMGYGPPAGMGYGPPPPPGDNYTHMFNDENTDSCSIM